jgi:hypothetical protein
MMSVSLCLVSALTVGRCRVCPTGTAAVIGAAWACGSGVRPRSRPGILPLRARRLSSKRRSTCVMHAQTFRFHLFARRLSSARCSFPASPCSVPGRLSLLAARCRPCRVCPGRGAPAPPHRACPVRALTPTMRTVYCFDVSFCVSLFSRYSVFAYLLDIACQIAFSVLANKAFCPWFCLQFRVWRYTRPNERRAAHGGSFTSLV